MWPGFDSCTRVLCGLSLLLVLYSAARGFPPGTQVSPFLKNQHFQISIRSSNAGAFQTSYCELLVLRGKQITFTFTITFERKRQVRVSSDYKHGAYVRWH